MSDEEEAAPWRGWYREAREIMAGEYGVRRVPRDAYRELWLEGLEVRRAVQQLRLHHDPHAHECAPKGSR